MFRPIYHYTTKLVDALLRVESARSAVEVLQLASDESRQGQDEARKTCVKAVQLLDNGCSAGYQRALAYIVKRSTTCPDQAAVRKLAAILSQTDEARLRERSVVTLNQAGELVYVPPDASDVPRLMAELEEWLRLAWERIPAVVTAGICHQALLMIHPYDVPNAALARLLANLVLSRRGYGLGQYAWPETWLAQNRSMYEKAVCSTHSGVYPSQANFTPWLEFFSQAVAAAATEARELVVSRSNTAGGNGAQLGTPPVYLRDRQRQALAFIRRNGAIRSGQYQQLVHVVPDTARRDFTDLMEKGLLTAKGVGRGTHYVLTNRGAEEALRIQG